MSYPCYPKYKDSGVDWIDRVPANWTVEPLGNKARMIVPMRDKPEELDGSIPWIRIEDFSGKYISHSKSGQGVTQATIQEMNLKVFPVGTVLCSCSCSMGATAIVQQPLISNQTFIGIVAGPLLVPDYIYYLMQSAKQHLNAVASGAIQQYLSRQNFQRLRVPVPSLPEQHSIAAFLDGETARIDTVIAKQEEMITVLQEKRMAIISHTVTRGLDPDVPLKDSGVEWLGLVPEHWEVKRFKHCCTITEGQVDPKDEHFNNRILIAPNHIESSTGRILYKETAAEQGAISGKYLVEPGEIIYSKIRPALNKVCIAEGHWLCSADMYPIRITRDLETKYLLYFLLSEPFVRLMIDESMRVAMPKVNRETLTVCPILVPPQKEQQSIMDYIDQEITEIDTLINKAQAFIDLLKEHRTSLISAAVTGKIDVRGSVCNMVIE